MKLSELDYTLPKELIAQVPCSPRDHSKLMVIEKKSGKIIHKHFYDLPEFLTSDDVLVFNKTKVFPARVFGSKEILLLRNLDLYNWEIMIKGKSQIGQKIMFPGFECEIISKNGKVATVKFNIAYLDLLKKLEKIGKTPLPPYIKRVKPESYYRENYQTVYAESKSSAYAENLGSAAAPTAGLHFTKELINKIRKMGVQIEFVTLHVGLGTFEPVHEENLEEHKIHEEYFEIDKATVERLKIAKENGKRIIAVGTTTTRVLESLPKGNGFTNLYILPGYKFKIVDGLITNFHLPKSTLLALVYAFAGQDLIKKAYKKAIHYKYKFFSFGDGMFIAPIR